MIRNSANETWRHRFKVKQRGYETIFQQFFTLCKYCPLLISHVKRSANCFLSKFQLAFSKCALMFWIRGPWFGDIDFYCRVLFKLHMPFFWKKNDQIYFCLGALSIFKWQADLQTYSCLSNLKQRSTLYFCSKISLFTATFPTKMTDLIFRIVNPGQMNWV